MKNDSNLRPASRSAIHWYLPGRLKRNLISYVAEQPIKILKYSKNLSRSWQDIQRENELLKRAIFAN